MDIDRIADNVASRTKYTRWFCLVDQMYTYIVRNSHTCILRLENQALAYCLLSVNLLLTNAMSKCPKMD